MSLALVSIAYAQEISVTQIAGGGEEPSPLNMDAAASWNVGNPYAVVIVDGDIYIGDYRWGSFGILKIDGTTNEITEFMKESGESTGDGGPVQKATTNDGIYGMAKDCEGNIYFSDQASGVVRKIDMTTGYVSLVAGNYESGDVIDGAMATETPLGTPAGIAFNGDCSKMWIADYAKHYVYEVDMNTGILTIIAGTGERAEAGDGVLAINSGFKNPHDMLYHNPEPGVEHLYIITYNKTLSRMDLNSGVLTRFAGNGGWCLDGDGGLAVEACFRQGVGLTMDPEGENIYFGDRSGVGIRRINLANEMIFAFAGSLENSDEDPLFGDGGPAVEARVKRGAYSAFDANGDFIFAETGGPGFIRKVDMSTGLITTLAGGAAAPLPQDLEGIAASSVNNLNAKAVLEKEGIVYVADGNNNVIRWVDQDGIIHIFAGEGGESGYTAGGHVDTANFGTIESMIWNDDRSKMYVADAGHDVVYEVDMSTMMVSVVVGTGSGGFTASGGMADTTMISDPHGLSLYGDTLYFVERGNHIVRKVDLSTGMVHHVAGMQGAAGNITNVAAAEAKFENLSGVAVDPMTGDVYIAQQKNHLIARMDAENDSVFLFKDGFTAPNGIMFDTDGELIVSDGNDGLEVYDITTGEMVMSVMNVGNAYNAYISDMGGYVASQTDGVYFGVMMEDAITMIDGYAEADDASAMTSGLMETAGAVRVLGDYIALYRDSVEARDTIYLEVLQELVDNANTDTIFSIIQSLADADDASVLEIFHLEYVGITNIVEENLMAYRDSVANSTTTELVDVAALQTLINEANANETDAVFAIIQGMAGGDASILETFHLIKVGIEGVVEMDHKYLSAYRDSIESQTTIADIPALQTIIDEVNMILGLENIQMMAEADDANTLTIKMLEDAGVTPGSAAEDRLMYYKNAVEDSTAATLPDAAALQGLVDDVNAWVDAAEAALATIDGYADASDATALTVDELETAWAMNVMADNLDAYKAEIASRDTIESFEALQMLVDMVNEEVVEVAQDAALTAIQGYADADDATAMTAEQLITAGAENVDADYLAEYKVAVEADSSQNLANADSIQKFIVDEVNMMMVQEAVDSIAGMAEKDDATDLSHALLFQAELTDHGSDRIVDSLRSKLESAEVDSAAASTQELIQGLIDDVNNEIKQTYIDEITTIADADNADNVNITVELLNNAGVMEVDDAEVRDSLIVRLNKEDVDSAAVATSEKMQAIVDDIIYIIWVDDQLDVLRAMATSNDASTLELALFEELELTFDYYNYTVYQDSIEARDEIVDLADLQAMIDAADVAAEAEAEANALATINQMAVDSDASGLTRDLLETALGSASMLEKTLRHFQLYQDSIAGQASIDSVEVLEAVIASANLQKGVEVIQDYAVADDAANMTGQELATAGVSGSTILPYNLEAYQDSVAGSTAEQVSTSAEIQGLVDEVNNMENTNALAMILAMSNQGDTSVLTIQMFQKAEVNYRDADYLQAYKAAIYDADALTTLAELQAVVDRVSALEYIKEMPGSNDADDLTIEMLQTAGVPADDLVAGNIDEYKFAVFDAAEITSLDDIITIIQETNIQVILDSILAMAGGDASSLTIDMLEIVGVPTEDLYADYLDAYKTEIENKTTIPDLERLTLAIQDANQKAALAEVQGMADGDAGALTIDLLALAGVPQDDLVAANLAAYQDTVEAVTAIAGQDALIELIQAVNTRITDVNPLALQNNILLYPNPTKGVLKFNFGKLNSHVFEVNVTDITGKVIVTHDLSVMKNTVDLSKYSSGLYFLQITLDNVSITRRVVLE